jgi:hypothetical protein
MYFIKDSQTLQVVIKHVCYISSRGSSVSIVTRLRTERPGFNSQQGKKFFLLTTASRPTLGPTQPLIQWVQCAVSLRLKRPGREADHSPPSSAEVKDAWSYTSTPWYLVKSRDFTFSFILKRMLMLSLILKCNEVVKFKLSVCLAKHHAMKTYNLSFLVSQLTF